MIDETIIDMPESLEEKYYFFLGLVEGAVEVGVLWSDSPLFEAIIQTLESSKELSEEEVRILDRYKELRSRPLPTPF